MSKAELVEFMAESADLTKADAARALTAFTEAVKTSLKKGDKITLVGFGTFSSSERAARDGRNPKTGEPMKIKASTVAKFKPGKALKDYLN